MGPLAQRKTYTHSQETFALVQFSAGLTLETLAPSTRTAYSKTVKQFTTFVSSLEPGLNCFPVSPMHINLFTCHLFLKGLSPATITTKVSALGFWHKLYDQPDPTEHFLVRRNLSAMRKRRPQVDSRPPLTLPALHTMCRTAESMGWSKYNVKLFRAMLILSFHGFLRPGEMTNSVNSISFFNTTLSPSAVTLNLLSYKHSKGKPAVLRIRPTADEFCPLKSLAQYLLLRGSHKGNLFCDILGKPIPYSWYNSRFRAVTQAASLNPALRPHSARIGAATWAAMQGVPEDRIKRMGRWVSSAYDRYLRLPAITL